MFIVGAKNLCRDAVDVADRRCPFWRLNVVNKPISVLRVHYTQAKMNVRSSPTSVSPNCPMSCITLTCISFATSTAETIRRLQPLRVAHLIHRDLNRESCQGHLSWSTSTQQGSWGYPVSNSRTPCRIPVEITPRLGAKSVAGCPVDRSLKQNMGWLLVGHGTFVERLLPQSP
jgi:hypothetical protein